MRAGEVFHSPRKDLPNVNLPPEDDCNQAKATSSPAPCTSSQPLLPAPQSCTTHCNCLITMCSLSRTHLSSWCFCYSLPPHQDSIFKTKLSLSCVNAIIDHYIDGLHAQHCFWQAGQASFPFYRCSKPDSESVKVVRDGFRPPTTFKVCQLLKTKHAIYTQWREFTSPMRESLWVRGISCACGFLKRHLSTRASWSVRS